MRRLVQLALLPAVLPLLACPFDNGTDPETKPDAPTIGIATAGNTSAEISFTAPANTGSAVITEYTVTCTAGGAATKTATGPASPITVTGMTNGTTYSCSVTATSSAGTSDASGSVAVTPATVPSAPTIGTVTPADGAVSVAYTASASNGGATITGYFATCASSSTTVSSNLTLTSPITVSPLFNGVSYNCSVRARNARGDSPSSGSATVTPAALPGAPTSVSATPGNGQATISFIEPSNGGSAITTYAVVCTPTSGAAAQANGSTSPITLTGMTNGVSYACNVRAANAIGAGPASGNVNVTPVGPPAAPTIGVATAGDAQASIAFTAPTNTGGSAITGYTVTCTASGQTTCTGTGSASPIVVTSLTNATQYSCSVIATNAIGNSSASGGVNVTPRTVPGAPTIGTATPGNTSASVAFTAPASNGGSNITGYTVTCTASGQTTRTGTGTASPITVSSLVNDVQYACSVVATNVAGNSSASASVSVTPTSAGLGTSTLCGYSWNAVNNAITNAGGTVYTSMVGYTCNTTHRTMTMNQIPDHPASALTTGNPNKMSAQTSPSSVLFTLSPATSATVTTSAHVVGWAINGAKFEPSTAETCPTRSYCSPINGQAVSYTGTWNVEALGQTLFSAGVDGANAHIQPGGAYHYHGMPDAYLTYLNKGQKLTLLGFAVDGFPIYAKWGYTVATDSTSAVIQMNSSYRLKTTIPAGRPDTSIVKYGTFTQDWEYVPNLGHLDQCNGRTGVTPEFPTGTYAYYITSTFPYIQRCHKGTVPP